MNFPCYACDGNREITVSRDDNPQNDRPVRCRSCRGTGEELCCWCSRGATVRAWAKEGPRDTVAHLVHYCAEHLEQDRRQGLIVLVVEEKVDAEKARAVG